MHTNKLQKGASLIEVLIALLILATGIVALVKFQGSLLQSRTLVNQRSVAVQLAESKLEELRHFSVIATTPGYTAYEDIASGTSSIAGVSAIYTMTWTVTENTNPSYKSITVTVTWTDPTGGAQSVTLNTIVGSVDPALSGTIMQGL